MTTFTTKKQIEAFDKEIAERKANMLKLQQKRHIAAARKETQETKKKKYKKQSRRSFIIAALQENIYDVTTLAEAIAICTNYKDVKANKKAVSGTIYDLTVNKAHSYIKCENARIVRVK